MKHKKEFFTDALHIFVLSGFAFAQPLFDLLARNATFFIARQSEPADIILLVITLSIVIPGILVAVRGIVSFLNWKAGKGVHYVCVALLVAVTVLPALKNIQGINGTLLIALAASICILFTVLYRRFNIGRTFLTILGPAIFIFPALFLLNASIYKVVLPPKDPVAITVKVDDPPPVIMVVFDELPVTSLMDGSHMIDEGRYPNFAYLARNAYWFRNATTVSDHSHIGVPAILTGNYPEQNKLPTITDYPKNIFTLLGNSYEFKAYEFLTQLCPERLCEKSATQLITRVVSLFADLVFVYLHIVLPADFTSELPEVSRSWKNFHGGGHDTFMEGIHGLVRTAKTEMAKDRGEKFREFIGSIKSTDKSIFYFHHSFLPHTPWNYFPSGTKYSVTGDKIKGLTGEYWGGDELSVREAFQRHLLQVGYVDRLLGELLNQLRTAGIYDRSLMIITSDHGVSFRPKDSRRYVGKTNYQDIMPILLFMKLPGQRQGVISDKNVETIDILPSIAEVINVQMPWPVDGRSVFDTSLPERTEKVIFAKQTAENRLVFNSSLDAKYTAVREKVDLFGSGSDDPYGLFRIGPHSELIGRPVSEIGVAGETNIWVQVDYASLFDNVDMKTFVPAHITGRVLQNVETSEPLNLAFAVNGVISAVSKSIIIEENKTEFSVIIPEISFQSGKNEIEVFWVANNKNKPVLSRTKSKPLETYSLKSSEFIVPSRGKSIAVTSDVVRGFLDVAAIEGDKVLFFGWAANVKEFTPADTIAIFVNGKFLYAGSCNLERPDLVKAYKKSGMLGAGFQYNLPIELFKDLANSEVRLFAISEKGFASELNYPKEYKWGRNTGSSQKKETASGLLRDEKTLPDETYTLTKTGREEEIIISAEGTSFQVVPHALKGSLDAVDVQEDYVHVSGWAADINNSEIPGAILIFVDKKFFFHGQLNSDRPDIAKTFNDEALEKSGFSYTFPLSRFEVVPGEARIFVISERGVASELQYPEDYKWGTKL